MDDQPSLFSNFLYVLANTVKQQKPGFIHMNLTLIH